jgi:Concanavalin A-like lectin/glucanases superfamily
MSVSIGPGINVGGGINLGGYGPWPPDPNGSLQFANGNGYVSITDSNRLSLSTGNNWTIEGWFYFNSYSNPDRYFGKYNNSNNEYIFWGETGFQRSFVTYSAGGGTQNMDCVFTNPSLYTWHHLAFVRSGSTFNVYQDGVVVGTSTGIVGSVNVNSGTPFELGYNANYNVSNFRVVPGVAVYTGAFTPPAAPLGVTQSSGTNISAITSDQTALLLNTYTATPLLDASGYYGNVPVTGTITYSTNAPF